MANTFVYECPYCKATLEVDKDNISETIVCPTCEKEVTVKPDTFYSGEIFAGEF